MARLPIEKVKEELEESGFEYLDGEYKNLKSPLKVKCEFNHEFTVNLTQVRKGLTCPICLQTENIIENEQKVETPPLKKGKRILSIDNATKTTGYGIFENGKLISYGLNVVQDDIQAFHRIIKMQNWMIGMINFWEIDVVGLESVHLEKNPNTLILLAKLLGVLEVAAYQATGVEPYIIHPSTWRSFCKVTGNNKQRKKEAAQEFVKDKFGFIVSTDAADAICLGCYVWEQEKFGEEVSW